ncbi:OmpW family protein [Echinicola strongylocentroti]|uniref:OmpW family protein n=1 Tax=Echinicola strongylocentroti TaxID=1795355 RepID=A0A2Z4ILP6_9BACT|nr:outer membrane beta-barrel protein [Echinicola strongylocentroti]AWW32051.1 OmpW family protein [Echinicola strongylocentroti]
MKKIVIMLVLGLFVSLQASAQESKVTLSYPIGFAIGDVSDYVKPSSFRGIAIDYRKMINDNVGVGFSTGWNVFYEELAYDTYEFENQAVSGKQYRNSNHVPILFNGAYYMEPRAAVNPFVSVGIGTVYTRRNTDMGQFTMEQEAWNFALAPEVGMLIEFASGFASSVSVQYYNGFQAGNELNDPQSYFALKIGFEL